MKNAINWFEIPVRDMDRAAACYETLLGVKLRRKTFGGLPYAVFPYEAPAGISGALVQDDKRAPGGGTTVYLNVDGQLDEALARSAAAKVTVVLPKTRIGEGGDIALFADTEGNVVGLNSSG